jgi:hypothetical protein
MLYCVSARRRGFPSHEYSWFGFIGDSIIHDDISLTQSVIPGLTKPAPYLIRGNPVIFPPGQAPPGRAHAPEGGPHGQEAGFPLEFIPHLMRGGNDPLCCD